MKYKGIKLEPILEEKILDHEKDYAFWDKSWKQIDIEKGGCVCNTTKGIKTTSYNNLLYDFVAEIPTPQKRERTVVEKVKYLQNLESELKDDEILVNRHESKQKWIFNGSIIGEILADNQYEFAIYKSEIDFDIIEIPEVEI